MKTERRIRQRKGKLDWRKIGAAAVATVLIAVMAIGLIPNDTARVLAADTIADLDTSTKYTESLGDNASTEFAGRIWTDKSVYDDDVTFEMFGGNTTKVTLADDEDFLVAYSALATGQEIKGHTATPLDVVFVIDLSNSMRNNTMDNGRNRVYNATVALNNAVKELLALNEYVRIGVVGYNKTSYTMLPLDHYEQRGTAEFFTCSGSTITINAQGTQNTYRNTTISTQSGTNLQKGIFAGMNMLATESSTTVNINGTEVKRIPSVILLTDGEPSNASNFSTWWNLSTDNNLMNANSPQSVYGMKALMTASYMKDAIDRNYGGSGTTAATVYSIGMGITGVSNTYRPYAYATINPSDSTLKNSTNSMVTAMQDTWEDYANNRTATLGGYTFNHPNTGYDIVPADKDIDGLYYVDAYYDADDAQAVTDVFDSIVTSISVKAAEVPTEIKGSDPLTDGYITYTDKLGQYMTVKDIKEIIYAGQIFTQKSISTTDGVTKYVFQGNVESPVYGEQNIDDIIITVSADKAKNETLTVKIPASVIPIRVNTVELNANGSVKSHTNNGAYPARVVYSVSVRNDILTTSNGVQIVDTSKVSAEYLEENTNEDGTVNFYSNLYTGTNVVNGMTAGDTTVEFEPAHTNPFYYIQEDMPIYTKTTGGDYVLTDAGTPISDTAIYYYYEEHYHGTAVESHYIERTGAQLKKTDIINKDGHWYRAAGSPRLNQILEFEGTKTQNATNTAQDFYVPTFQYAEGSTDPYAGKFVVYLGNNGVLSIASTGNLEISKTVVIPEGLEPGTDAFEFEVNFNGNATLAGTYPYVVVNADGTTASEGTVADKGIITLKDGQKATINHLPDGTTYEVTEKEVAGFATETDGNTTGLIEAGKTSSEVFTNTYKVETVTFPAQGGLEGKKVLSGRPYDANVDNYTFFLTPYNNAPLPTDYNAETGVSVTLSNGNEAEFDFGSVVFEKPGIYRYTIVEKEPENDAYLPGMSYSRALYRVVVTVSDNGDGTLNADANIQKLYTDAADPLFTYGTNNEIVMNAGQEAQDEIVFINTYSVADVTRTPVALKTYTDNSGNKPLVSGMFKFELSPVGVVQGQNVVANTVSQVPMPLDGMGNKLTSVVTENEGHNITFLPVTFKHSDIPTGQTSITFRYKMNEVVPSGSEAVPGMTYDNSEYYIDVVVSIASGSDALIVNAVYPNEERILSFVNTYTPEPVSTAITGTKTLNGRDMLAGETFEFTLTAADDTTKAVLSAEKKVTVSNGKNGVASEFSFGSIEFTKPGTYVFNVKETKGNAGGVAYDTHTEVVTVEVVDNNGTLEITNSNSIVKAEFVNTYTSTFVGTGVSLSGAKHLTGKSLLAGEFYFVVRDEAEGTEKVVTHTVDETHTGGVYHGDIQFLENVTYTEAGVYEYYIKEQIPDKKVQGTTYDESIYRYTVTVTDDFNGNLSVTDTKLEISEDNRLTWNESTDDIIFENAYEPNPLVIDVSPMHKLLEGNRAEKMGVGEFTFTLSLTSANPTDGIQLPSTTTVGNDKDGYVDFGSITFTKAGTYTVQVKENVPDEATKNEDGTYTLKGVIYTAEPISATYEVTDDRNGTLTARIVSSSGRTTFTNVYESEGTLQLEISKEFTGRAGDQWLSTDKFEFEAVILDPTTQEAVEAGDIVFVGDTAGNTNPVIDKKDETITGTILIKKAGTYKFIVREVTTNPIPGVIYDSTPREIVVTATDQSDGTIDVVYTITDGLTLTFKNHYDEESTELSGHDNLWVVKEFTGRNWTNEDSFTFILAAHDQDAKDAVAANATNNKTGIQLPNTTLVVTTANKAHAHFGNIIFHEAGEYEFSITEQVPDGATEVDGKYVKDGITYDNTPRIVTVKVVDNTTEGRLEVTAVSVTPNGNLTFTNTYEPKETTVVGSEKLELIKVLNGRAWSNEDIYTFTLEAVDETLDAVQAGDIVYKGDTEINIKNSNPKQEASDGTEKEETRLGAFGDIVFKKAGTYSFIIQERKGNIDNISYDANSIYVTVNVTDDGKGQLHSSVAYSVSSITFTNTYTPDPVTVAFEGTKVLNGDRTLAKGEFHFHIEGINNPPMPTVRTIANGSEGYTSPIKFGAITYDKEGTYSYVISEIKGQIPGVEYDAQEVYVTVEVTYDDTTGTLIPAISYEKGGQTSSTGFTFTNTYHKSDISIVKEQAINGGARTQTLKTVRENDKVTYYLVVSNAGKGDASNVVVEDMIPTGLILDAINDGGKLGADGTITWNIGTVEAETTKTVSFTVVVPDVKVETTWKNIGIVAYTHPGKDIPEEKDSNEVEINQGIPVVVVEKTQQLENGSATKDKLTVREGDKVTYSITVKNTGTEVASGVVIEDKIPEGLTLVNGSISNNGVESDGTITWQFSEIAKGATEQVSFQVVVPDVEVATTWENIATVDFTNDPEDPQDEKDPEPSNEVEIEEGAPNVLVEKFQSVNGNASTKDAQSVKAGDKVTYVIKVKNIGTEVAEDVDIKDAIPEGLALVDGSIVGGGSLGTDGVITWNIGDLAIGNEKEVSFTVTVPNTEDEFTVWTNIATANHSNDPKNPDEPDDSNPVTVMDTVNAGLTGVKRMEGDRATVADQEFSFKIEAVTSGAPMPDVTEVKNDGSGIFTFGPITYTEEGQYTYKITEVHAGETIKGVTYDDTVYYAVVKVEEVSNTTTAVSYKVTDITYYKDSVNGTASTTLTFVNTYYDADLAIAKTQSVNDGNAVATKLTVRENDKVTYYLTVTNNGKGEASNVIVTDVIPDGLVLVKNSISNNGVESDGTITWNLAKLTANASVTVSFSVVVPDVKENTAWKNVAVVVYDNPDDDPQEETSNEVEVEEGIPQVSAEKLQSVNGGEAGTNLLAVKKGDKVTYYIVIRNTGTEAASGIVVTDAIPKGLTLVEGSISNNGVMKDGVITWNLGELAADGTITVSFSVTVPEVDEKTTWKNIATVDYTNDPENPTDPEPSNPVEIVEEPEVVHTVIPTSDNVNAMFYFFLAIAAFATAVLSLNSKRRII